LQSESKFEIRN